jgi:hypothetical protein
VLALLCQCEACNCGITQWTAVFGKWRAKAQLVLPIPRRQWRLRFHEHRRPQMKAAATPRKRKLKTPKVRMIVTKAPWKNHSVVR